MAFRYNRRTGRGHGTPKQHYQWDEATFSVYAIWLWKGFSCAIAMFSVYFMYFNIVWRMIAKAKIRELLFEIKKSSIFAVLKIHFKTLNCCIGTANPNKQVSLVYNTPTCTQKSSFPFIFIFFINEPCFFTSHFLRNALNTFTYKKNKYLIAHTFFLFTSLLSFESWKTGNTTSRN